jgi:predicted DNA-binding protein YlxM (UPF0122 family)
MNNEEDIAEVGVGGAEHPSPEQLMLREAVSKALLNKQRRVWELFNYDRLTHAEIAKKLHVTPSAITQQIRTIEKQLQRWIQEHKEVYQIIKESCE